MHTVSACLESELPLTFGDVAMPLPKEQAWFPRKSYGLGWGIPSRWQGWVMVGVYLLGLAAVNLSPPRMSGVWQVSAVIGLTVLLLAVCYWKGEAPKWSWGGKDEDTATKTKRR